MVKGTTKNNGQKDKLDRFYTSPDEALRLLSNLPAVVPMLAENPDCYGIEFYEPSAGDGAFVRAVEELYPSASVRAFDIAPSPSPLCDTAIGEQDFLDADIPYSDNRIVIGNPPFGEQGRLCFQFVEKALDIAPTVCFILPPSFKKESYRKRIGLSPVAVIELDDTAYRVGDGLIDVPSCFFVFDREHPFVEDEIDFGKLPFEFLPKADTALADFTIRRVGGTSGTAAADTSVSTQSNYFCRTCDGYDTDTIIDTINGIDFPERDWSVGPRSLSQREIARRVIEAIGELGKSE